MHDAVLNKCLQALLHLTKSLISCVLVERKPGPSLLPLCTLLLRSCIYIERLVHPSKFPPQPLLRVFLTAAHRVAAVDLGPKEHLSTGFSMPLQRVGTPTGEMLALNYHMCKDTCPSASASVVTAHLPIIFTEI